MKLDDEIKIGDLVYFNGNLVGMVVNIELSLTDPLYQVEWYLSGGEAYRLYYRHEEVISLMKPLNISNRLDSSP